MASQPSNPNFAVEMEDDESIIGEEDEGYDKFILVEEVLSDDDEVGPHQSQTYS